MSESNVAFQPLSASPLDRSKKDKPIRVAQILNRMDSGGIEAVVMTYYRHIDRNRVQFDFYFAESSRLPHIPTLVLTTKHCIQRSNNMVTKSSTRTSVPCRFFRSLQLGGLAFRCAFATTTQQLTGVRARKPCSSTSCVPSTSCSRPIGLPAVRWLDDGCTAIGRLMLARLP